ncbi:hypothetical protein ED733_004266 [Metarhizium rileyi]|uniref:Ecp2 effector protein domain-containing protein n=1 Tax=Metarhizium rileyi (strain RCEF 4871) TaxID=1649241 RepID=A0A5C6G963_METRR|nr:hypothetical protein ED733_004266 [Metarhizium rileyi]
MLSSKIIVLFSFLSSQAVAFPTTEERNVIPGYTVADLKWEVEVFPGQPTNLTGTFDEVRRQATQLNPRWDEVNAQSGEETSGRLDKRIPIWTNVVCGPGPNKFEWADASIVREKLIPKVRSWGKTLPSLPARTCGAMACYDGNYLMLCNDNTWELRLQGYIDVADGAQKVLDACQYTGAVVGQQFAQGSWNVIVTSSHWGQACRG